MSKTNAIAMACLALQEAAAFEHEADEVQPRQPADPSGADDAAALAEDQRAALRKAAEGRVGDALVALHEFYPAAFERVKAPRPAPPIESAPPAAPPPPPPPPVEQPTAPVDPTGGPIAEPAPVAPQDPSTPTNG